MIYSLKKTVFFDCPAGKIHVRREEIDKNVDIVIFRFNHTAISITSRCKVIVLALGFASQETNKLPQPSEMVEVSGSVSSQSGRLQTLPSP